MSDRYEKRKKLSMIYTAVTVLGILLLVVFFFFQYDFRRYELYERTDAGFSILYPDDWEVKPNTNGAAVVFYSPKTNDLDILRESVNVVIQDLRTGNNPLNLRSYTIKAIEQMKGTFQKSFMVKESASARLGGLPAHRLVFLGKGPDGDLKYMITWALKDKVAYIVTYTAFDATYDTYEKVGKKMTNSFKLM